MSEHPHVFDPISGYCVSGCVGYREDGRLIHKGGAILRPAPDEQLDTEHEEQHA